MVAIFGARNSRTARMTLRAVFVLLCAIAVGPIFSSASAQTLQEKLANKTRRIGPFNLSSGPLINLTANLVACGVKNVGEICTDPNDSPTAPGSYWPAGTTNQYIFNSGLQVAGIYGAGAPASGVFARGDTVGAFFFDGTGRLLHGSGLTDVFSSLDPNDIANWPTNAYVTDTTIFNRALFSAECLAGTVTACPKAVSDQDTYVEYWDGNPLQIQGRTHPAGIRVRQRSLAFNAPSGAEHTLFFIFQFENVTNDPQFQSLNEARFNQQLPDGGWTIDSVFAAFAMDPDVTTHAGENFASALLPLNMGFAYKDNFVTDDFNFGARADLYAPPFFQGPGFIGVKYLRSPRNPTTGQEIGLTMFSNTTNGGEFPDPGNVKQLYRYLKGTPVPALGDPQCTVPNAVQRRICALPQAHADARFYQASGPFSLRPGESQTVVVAYTHGAPFRAPGYVPGTEVFPGIPSNIPGQGTDTIRTIERIAGLINIPEAAIVRDANGAAIRVNEAALVPGRDFVPRSLVANALVAQTIFNNRFLLPRPPESPQFSLVPGDEQVTVVWGPSATDVNCTATSGGDPFAAIASNESSTLFNPNYRRCDVEGYRIYRASGLQGDFQLVAQFDKTGTSFIDFTCETDPSFVPEEGEECEPHEVQLTGTIQNFFAGGRVRNAVTGSVQLLPDAFDTITLSDTGVPFAYVDRGVRNGVTYRYRVTAFDVNSLASGALSLESPSTTQFTTPRKDPNNLQLASFTSSLANAAGQPLPTHAYPTVNSQTGIFSGPMPPTNGLSATFSPLVERLLPAFNIKASIDSIIPYTLDTHPAGCPAGFNALGVCWRTHMTFERDGVRTSSVAEGWSPHSDFFGDPLHTEFAMGSGFVPPDAATSTQFGLPASFPGFGATVVGTFPMYILSSSSEGFFNRRAVQSNHQIYPGFATGVRFIPGGSRWFSGANETVADPTRLIRVGSLTGVDTVWAPIHHTPTAPGGNGLADWYPASTQMQCWTYIVPSITRAADIRFTWGANGAVTVTDVSHNTPVIFKPTAQASYGFLNTDANGNGVIDWNDFNYIENVSPALRTIDGGPPSGFCGHTDNPAQRVRLEATPKMNPVSTAGTTIATAKPATGQGFGLYVNGERYIFDMAGDALPASGQTWTVRSYSGLLRAPTGAVTLDPSGYTFWANFAEADVPEPRPPMVTGIVFSASAAQGSGLVGDTDITQVHTVPDPYYARSGFDIGPSNKSLRFVNLPPQAIIRIYSLNGTLVRVLEHNDPRGGAEGPVCSSCPPGGGWDLRNRNNQFVASGVYFFVVEAPNGDKHTGKFTVVQFAR